MTSTNQNPAELLAVPNIVECLFFFFFLQLALGNAAFCMRRHRRTVYSSRNDKQYFISFLSIFINWLGSYYA